MKKKFFLCLRPMVIEEKDTKPRLLDRSDDGVSTIKSSVSDNESLIVSYPRREKGSSRQTFCRVLKAILFQVSVKKRVRDRMVYQLTFPSKTDSILDVSNDKSVNLDLPESNIQKPRPNSTISASLSSSLCSSLSSEAKNFRSLSIKKSLARSQSNSFNQKRQTLTNYTIVSCLSSSNSVLFSILVALFFTIFWGKLCAILFTSAWLYFLPSRSVSHQRPQTVTKLPETETSRDNKKRVIMEGLLERNHHLQRALNFPLERRFWHV